MISRCPFIVQKLNMHLNLLITKLNFEEPIGALIQTLPEFLLYSTNQDIQDHSKLQTHI